MKFNESLKLYQSLLKYKNWAGYLFLIFSLFFIYWPSFYSGPILDDNHFIFQSHLITKNMSPWVFWSANPHESKTWPLIFLIFQQIYKLVGTNYFIYKIINIIFHLFNCFLFLHILKKIGIKSTIIVFIIFLLHPIHIETNSWIFQFKTIISTTFFLFSYALFLKYLSKRKIKYLVISLLLIPLSLYLKITAIFFPILYLFHLFKIKELKTIIISLPFFVVALVIGLETIKGVMIDPGEKKLSEIYNTPAFHNTDFVDIRNFSQQQQPKASVSFDEYDILKHFDTSSADFNSAANEIRNKDSDELSTTLTGQIVEQESNKLFNKAALELRNRNIKKALKHFNNFCGFTEKCKIFNRKPCNPQDNSSANKCYTDVKINITKNKNQNDYIVELSPAHFIKNKQANYIYPQYKYNNVFLELISLRRSVKLAQTVSKCSKMQPKECFDLGTQNNQSLLIEASCKLNYGPGCLKLIEYNNELKKGLIYKYILNSCSKSNPANCDLYFSFFKKYRNNLFVISKNLLPVFQQALLNEFCDSSIFNNHHSCRPTIFFHHNSLQSKIINFKNKRCEKSEQGNCYFARRQIIMFYKKNHTLKKRCQVTSYGCLIYALNLLKKKNNSISAIKYFKRLCHKDFSMLNLISCLWLDNHYKLNGSPALAKKFLKQAKIYLSDIPHKYKKHFKSTKDITKYLESGCEKNNGKACYLLAGLTFGKIPLRKNDHYFKKGCTYNHYESCRVIFNSQRSTYMFTNKIINKNNQEHLKKLCESNTFDSQQVCSFIEKLALSLKDRKYRLYALGMLCTQHQNLNSCLTLAQLLIDEKTKSKKYLDMFCNENKLLKWECMQHFKENK